MNNGNFGQFSDIFHSIWNTDNSVNILPPAYDIVKCGDDYTLTMVVAGFDEKNLKIEVENNKLTISGFVQKQEDSNIKFLHRGIAEYAFNRSFQLRDHMKVKGAKIKNGLLHVQFMLKIPDEARPRQIPIINNFKEFKENDNVEPKIKNQAIKVA
jgi:molecular chaperone IbpA